MNGKHKEDGVFRLLRRLLKLSGGGMKYVILLIIRSPFDALNTFIQASFLMYAFNSITSGDAEKLTMACITFVIVCLCLFVYNGTVWGLFGSNYSRMAGQLRINVFNRLSGISLKELESRSYGEWMTRLNLDIGMAERLLAGAVNVPHAVVSSVGVIVSGALLFVSDKVMFLLVIAFVVPHVLVSRYVVTKPVTKLKKQVQDAVGENSLHMDTIVTGSDVSRLYDAEDFLLGKFERSSLEIRRANMRIHRHNALSSAVLPLFGMSGYLVVLFFGAKLINEGSMTFGMLTANLQLRGGVLIGMMMLSRCFVQIRANLAGVSRLTETVEDK